MLTTYFFYESGPLRRAIEVTGPALDPPPSLGDVLDLGGGRVLRITRVREPRVFDAEPHPEAAHLARVGNATGGVTRIVTVPPRTQEIA